MKRTKACVAAVLCTIVLSLSGCSSEVEKAISNGDQLFEQGNYPQALEAYQNVEDNAEGRGEIDRAVFEKGKELLDSGNYQECDDYFRAVIDSDTLDTTDVGNYLQLSYAYDASETDMGVLYRTRQLLDMSEQGFEPAAAAIDSGKFDGYLKLAQAGGLYKSENLLQRYTAVPGTTLLLGGAREVNSYIYLDSKLYATVLAAEGAVVQMTGEEAKSRAQDNEFNCNIHVTENGAYGTAWHCWASYRDRITGDEHKIEFDMALDGDSLVLSNIDSTEDAGGQTLVAGRYIRME